MQAAQIKYIYVYAPVCQGRELFLSPVKRGVFFLGYSQGFFHSAPVFLWVAGNPGLTLNSFLSRLSPLTRAPDICCCLVFVTRVLPEGLGLPGWSGVLEYAHPA